MLEAASDSAAAAGTVRRLPEADADPAAAARSGQTARTPRRIGLLMTHSAAGGIRELWEDLAEGLAARGHRVRVAALYPAGTGDAAGVEHVDGARPRSPLGLLRLATRLVRYLRENRFDAVFTAMPVANALVPLAARAAGVGTRVFVTHHTPFWTYNRGLALIDRWTGRMPEVRGVVTVSDAVGAALDGYPEAYRAKRITIHNALPPRLEARISALRAARGNRSGGGTGAGRRVIAVGRLAEQKNYPVLLRAAARMPDVTVEIVGSGPEEAALRALARDLGVDGRVSFAGQMPREAALARMAAADVFVQPSLFEGHSLGLIEAAAQHLPLVVSDVPVQVEGVTAPDGRLCGAVVGVHDDAALARAITGLLDDPARRRAAAADAAHLAAGRTYGAMVAAYEALACRA